jgi:ferrous iron transport protein A
MKKIQDLFQGEHARLVCFGQTGSSYRRQLLALGLTLGTQIKIMHIAPLGCPIHIEVRGVGLALRKDEACFLEWETV